MTTMVFDCIVTINIGESEQPTARKPSAGYQMARFMLKTLMIILAGILLCLVGVGVLLWKGIMLIARTRCAATTSKVKPVNQPTVLPQPTPVEPGILVTEWPLPAKIRADVEK